MITGKFQFWSGKNYLKRDSSSGSMSMLPPQELLGGGWYVTQNVITHNLGYIPFFTIAYEPFGDGVIWEGMSARVQTIQNPLDFTQFGPYFAAYPGENTLTLQLGYTDQTLTQSYPVYWNIYVDYSL